MRHEFVSEHPSEAAPGIPVTQQDWFVKWIPVVVPLLAVVLLLATFLIEADVL